MTRIHRLVAVCVCGLAWGAGAAWIAADENAPAGIDWRTDLEEAQAEAERSGKPMLIVFR